MSNLAEFNTWILKQDTLLELYELDLQPIGINNQFYFTSEKYSNGLAIVYKGNSYNPLSLESSGYESSHKAPFPSPTMRMSNVFGSISAILLIYEDLVGSKVTRIRVHSQYVNDPAAPELPREVYFVERVISENEFSIEFQLVSGVTLNSAQLPARRMLRKCTWQYRGSDCQYADMRFYTEDNKQTFDQREDRCGKTVAACKLRFGNHSQLNHSGYPSVDT